MPHSYYRQPAPPLPDPATLPFPGNLVRQCEDCGLRHGCSAPVPGYGSVPAEIMLVGQNPGRQEDEWGKPFVGQAGEYLDSLLFQASVPRSGVYITNVVKCLTANNRALRPDEVAACTKWLDIEVGLVQPRIIVAMGKPAIDHFLGSNAGTVEHLHGKPIEKDGHIILPAYHPAAALHNTTLLRQCSEDFQVLRGLVAGRDPAEYHVVDEYPNPEYRVVDTPARLKQMLDEVREVGECAIDVETVKRDSELWSVQVSAVPGTAWFIPIKQTGHRVDVKGWNSLIIVHHYLHDINFLDIPDDNFTDTMVSAYLTGQSQGLKELASRLCGISMKTYREVVRSGQSKLSTQYLIEALKHEWPDPPVIEETKWNNKAGKLVTKQKHPWHISRKINKMLVDAGVADSVLVVRELPDKRTKTGFRKIERGTVRLRVGSVTPNPDIDLWDRWQNIPEEERTVVENVIGSMPESSLADIKFEDAVQYACRDADATLRVKHKLDKMITDLGLDFVQHMDVGILPMVDDMMRNGMAVDLDHFRALSVDYDARMRAKSTEMAALVGHPFNPASSQQVAAVVYQELGFKPTAYTPSKEISTDDAELKKVKHPVAEGIIRYRGLQKLKGTYADALVEWARPDDEGIPRVHTTLKTTRVETGRLASADPNLQNIPTRNKEAKAIKNGFVAPTGKVLAEGDLSQIEMVTLTHLSKCKRLMELFLRGGDPHTEMAATLFGVPLEEAAKSKYRYPVKRLNFGIAYLIGPQGMANQIQEYIADLMMEGEPVDIEPWDELTCEKFIIDWYKLNPEVKDFQMEQAAHARRYGYVQDIFGRIRYIPEVNCPVRSIQEAGVRQAANQPVTASAQGIIKTAMCELWRKLPKTQWTNDVKWLLQIHDSLLVEVTDDEAVLRGFLPWMHDIMCGVVKLLVPVKADFKIGKKWGELKKISL